MFKNILKKVIVCPNCGQRSRIPIKPGKVLRVTCPNCQNIFDIKFESPKSQFNNFNIEKIISNLKNFPKLPSQQKVSYILVAITLLFMLRSCGQESIQRPASPSQNQPPSSINTPGIINL